MCDMLGYIDRIEESKLEKGLKRAPVAAMRKRRPQGVATLSYTFRSPSETELLETVLDSIAIRYLCRYG